MDVYLSTVVIAFILFVFNLQFKEFSGLKVLGWIGKNLSAYIYILHFPVIEAMETLMPLELNTAYIKPIIAIIITIIASALWYIIKNVIKYYCCDRSTNVI